MALVSAHRQRRYLGPAVLALLVLLMLGSLVPDPSWWHPFMVAPKASFGGKTQCFRVKLCDFISTTISVMPALCPTCEVPSNTPS